MITIRTARWIDRKFGKPLCRILSVIGRFRKKTCPLPNEIRRIVIIKMWGMGSVILSSSAIRNMRLNCPEAHITLITLKQNQSLYAPGPWINQLMYFDLNSLPKAIRSLYQIMSFLRAQPPDIVFDFEFASRFTAMLSFWSYRSFLVGFNPSGSAKNIFDITIPYSETRHISKIFMDSLKAVKFTIHTDELIPCVAEDGEKSKVDAFLKTRGINRFIVFNPNTSSMAPERQWPLERFAELAKRWFADESECVIIVIGGTEDIQRVETLCAMVSSARMISACGHFTIAGTSYMLSKAHALVTNDSGPMHLATLSNTPTIGLFGPETPALYGPVGVNQSALSSNEYCSPCISIYNDKKIVCYRQCACMQNISVSQVYKTLNSYFSKNPSLEIPRSES